MLYLKQISYIMRVLLVLFAITLPVCHGFVLDILRELTTCSDSQQSILPATDIERSCLDDANKGMCRFYDCFERRFPCDTCGFAKEYGKNVCEKFETPTIYNRFDDAGKRWVDATNRCLLAKMKELYQRHNVRCEVTRTTMLEQVSNCYLFNDAGVSFCDIAVANRDVFRAIFEAGQVIRSPRVLTEVVQLIKTCASSGSNPIADRVRDFRANNNSLKDLRNRIREMIMNSTSGGVGGLLRDVIAESGASGNGIAAGIRDILSNRRNTIAELVGQVLPLSRQLNQLAGNGPIKNTSSDIGRGELLSQTFNRIQNHVKQLMQENPAPISGSQNNRPPMLGGFFQRFLRKLTG